MRKTGVLAIQIGWTEDKEDNLRRALALIDEGMATYNKVDLICLPEMYYVNPTRKNLDTVGMPLWNPLTEALADCARKYQANIMTGCFPWKSEDGMYNTCLCLNRKGEIVGKYSKTYLFDALNLKESDLVKAGEEMCIVDFDFGRVGIAVCYEIRFPEYLRQICSHDVELLCLPAAFYVPRGEHWDILTKAAALQNLTFLCAVNQYSRFYIGDSRIVSPEGTVLCEADDGETFIYGEIDLDSVEEARKKYNTYKNYR